MLNYWWLCSEVVMAAMQAIADGTPDADPLINSGVSKFCARDGMTHLNMFKQVTRDTKQWSVANVYGVTQEETDAFLAKWPNDLELGGCWERATGIAQCAIHADLLQYMPDECHAYDTEGNCIDLRPATTLKQVVLLPPQQPRQFV